MKKEQIEFLKNLKKEILTQDNLATRDVMFAVLETKERYDIDSDYCDYQVMVADDTVFRDMDDVIDNFPDFEEELKDMDLESACYYLHNQGYDVRMCGVKEMETFDFMNGQSVFFTSKACKEFIERNKHNLSSPVCYGISAWNNPEMRTLREIIISTDWELQDVNDSLRKNNVKMLIDAIEYQGASLSSVQKQILEKITFDNAKNYNFELIANISKDFAEYDFYTALFESELITDYFDKLDTQTISNWWIKENKLLEEYKEYDGVLTPFEFISENKDTLESFLKFYFKIVE